MSQEAKDIKKSLDNGILPPLYANGGEIIMVAGGRGVGKSKLVLKKIESYQFVDGDTGEILFECKANIQ